MGDLKAAGYKDPFINELVQFVGGKKFQSEFEAFFLNHAMEFSFDEEHKLIYSEMYKEFSEKFEGYLEEFCKEKEMTHAEFMKKCRDCSAEDDKAQHYINILLSSCEYETFVRLMKIMRPAAEAKQLKSIETKPTSLDKAGGSFDHDAKGGHHHTVEHTVDHTVDSKASEEEDKDEK